MVLFKTVRYVFKKDEAEDNVFVFCRIHIAAEFVGCEPELRFEADVGRVV
jgi:hypothetical protein